VESVSSRREQTKRNKLTGKIMDSDEQGPRSLREMEEEAIEEGREFARKRLQEKLQEQARRYGGVFPPQPKKGVASAKGAPADAHSGGRS
jgi:hypothetical protein